MKDKDFEQKFTLRPLPIRKDTDLGSDEPSTDVSVPRTVRLFVDVSPELAEKFVDEAYWERRTRKENLLYIVENYYKDRIIKPRPEEAKNRKSPGRKIKR